MVANHGIGIDATSRNAGECLCGMFVAWEAIVRKSSTVETGVVVEPGVIVEPAEPTNKTPAFPPLPPCLDTSTTVLTLITENSFVFASVGETKSKVDVMTGTLFIQAL